MTREQLDPVDREALIDQVLASHRRAEEEQARRIEAERQLAWFKQQLFGRKSERRLPAANDPEQLTLGQALELDSEPRRAEPRSVREHLRRPPQIKTDRDDKGLRFDESVPVETIEVPAPELLGPDADQYRVIAEKETFRLAQQPCAYKVLRYVRPVVQRIEDKTLLGPLAPASVVPGSYADVSLLAVAAVAMGLRRGRPASRCPTKDSIRGWMRTLPDRSSGAVHFLRCMRLHRRNRPQRIGPRR